MKNAYQKLSSKSSNKEMNIKTYLVDVCVIFFPSKITHRRAWYNSRHSDHKFFYYKHEIFQWQQKKPRINKAEISRRKHAACPPILDLQLSSELDSDKLDLQEHCRQGECLYHHISVCSSCVWSEVGHASEIVVFCIILSHKHTKCPCRYEVSTHLHRPIA